MPACQMIIFPRKNYNINNLNSPVLINSIKYNKNPIVKVNNQNKYIQEKASPWKQKAFGIKTISKLPGGCGCGG